MRIAEDRLVQLLAEAAPEGIEALYDAYGSLAYTLAHRILSDPDAAEDVVQECFLAVWRKSETYHPDRGSLKSWVCRIARNRAIDRLRRNRQRVDLDVSLDAALREPALSDTWAEVAAMISQQQVREALDALPVEQRETIELAYFGGYTQTQISESMHVPLGTVKGRIRLALVRLHGRLSRVEAT